ncbi:Uncharacterised protein [Yersinia pseudotuberculosis]|nr:Uncharacterised protein [Yersinia pseudotuberculosis]
MHPIMTLYGACDYEYIGLCHIVDDMRLPYRRYHCGLPLGPDDILVMCWSDKPALGWGERYIDKLHTLLSRYNCTIIVLHPSRVPSAVIRHPRLRMIAGHGYKRGLRALRQLIRDSIASLTERKREDDLSVPPESVKRTGAVYESLMSDCGVTKYAREKGACIKTVHNQRRSFVQRYGFSSVHEFRLVMFSPERGQTNWVRWEDPRLNLLI